MAVVEGIRPLSFADREGRTREVTHEGGWNVRLVRNRQFREPIARNPLNYSDSAFKAECENRAGKKGR